MPQRELILVGNPGSVHVGAHFYEGAGNADCTVTFLNAEHAFSGSLLITKFNWFLRGHRPTCLQEFSASVLRACVESRPRWVLATGIAPISGHALRKIGALGIERLNYLTDDPWNPCHKAPWFMHALSHYDHVFSPRRGNLEDLRKFGPFEVSHLPFAYSPEMHFPDPPANREEIRRFSSDVVFAGGADSDRLRYFAALIREGFRVALYGGYWERYSETKAYAMGHADPPTLRKAIGGSKVALCLVRRANRDGHSMRTFELPAIGACMLTEYTEEHEEIFGKEGKAVVYFRSIPEMVDKLRWLLAHNDERQRLAVAAHRVVVNGQNTYSHRLSAMLALVRSSVGST